MKKLLLLAAVLMWAVLVSGAEPTNMGGRNAGLGLELGDYPGITGKLWISNINAFSAGLGFGPFTRVHLDYLWHDFSVFKVDEGRLPLYYGVGGIINTYDTSNVNAAVSFGVRGTVGVTYIFKGNNFDIFFELSPTLRFDPVGGLFLSGAVGARYFFL